MAGGGGLETFPLDFVMSRVQDAVDSANRKTNNRIDGLNGLDGSKIIECDLGTSFRGFTHGLGRSPRGYIVVDLDTHATIIRQAGQRPQDQISLAASAACKAKVLVF